MAEQACRGGRVLEYFDLAECAECGTRVRWDLREHPFWGFQNCAQRDVTQPDAAEQVDDDQPEVA